jgi:hypothetical protein
MQYVGRMSAAEPTAPKQRVIGKPFAPGQSGNPNGRPRGRRNRLADNFVADLAAAWNEYGEIALKRCAEETPDKFCKIVADLMPRDVNLNVALDATAFADRLAQAAALLGHEIDPPRRIRPALPGQPRVIEHSK